MSHDDGGDILRDFHPNVDVTIVAAREKSLKDFIKLQKMSKDCIFMEQVVLVMI